MEHSVSLEQHGLKSKKIRATALIFISMLIFTSLSINLNQLAREYTNKYLVQAFESYGLARLFDGRLSEIESLQVEGGIVFVDAKVSPFKWLEPMRELVEDYAGVQKIALASLAIQKVLLEVTESKIFGYLVAIFGMALAIQILIKKVIENSIVAKAFATSLLMKYVVVVVALFSWSINQSFFAEMIQTNQQKINSFGTSINAEGNALKDSDLDEIKNKIELIKKSNTDLNNQLSNLEPSIKRAKSAMSDSQSALDTAKSKESLWQRYSPISHESDDLKKLEEENNANINSYNNLNSTCLDIKEKIGENNTKISELNNKLNTQNPEFINSLKQKIDSISNLSVANIKHYAESAMNALFDMIAIFIINTIIIPILTLVIIMKAFKLIWNIELKTGIKDTYRYAADSISDIKESSTHSH